MSNRNRNIESNRTDMYMKPEKVNPGYPESADSTAAERRAEDADIEDFNFADDYDDELPDEEQKSQTSDLTSSEFSAQENGLC